MKTHQELDKIIETTRMHDIYPSKIPEYMAEFSNSLKNKLITHYISKEKGVWEVFEKDMLMNIAKTEYGLIKKTSGIEIFLIDSRIFIPVTESSFLDLFKKKYTSYSNSPKYAVLNEGLLLHIPIHYKKSIQDTYHFLETHSLKSLILKKH